MKLTMKKYDHYGAWTGQLESALVNNPKEWDKIRKNEEESLEAYSIPEDPLIWQKRCTFDQQICDHAQAITHILKPRFKRINSFGVGRGCLEYLIKRNAPEVFVQCSDFAVEAIERLKKIFVNADEIIRFNMLEDRWQNDGSECVYLFYRLDTEFNNRQWGDIFLKLSQAGIENVLFIASDFLKLKRILIQECKHFTHRLLNRKMVFTGYLRTEEKLKSLFSNHYEISHISAIKGQKIFLLKKSYKNEN